MMAETLPPPAGTSGRCIMCGRPLDDHCLVDEHLVTGCPPPGGTSCNITGKLPKREKENE